MNYEREYFFENYWNQNIDFNDPDLLTLGLLWTYKIEDKVYYGMHELINMYLNLARIQYDPTNKSCFDNFPLKIDISF